MAPSPIDERTFIMAKPDAVQRGLVGKIIARFESKGFKLVAMKFCSPSKAHLEEHYADLSSKPFFPGLIEYMTSGPVVAMVWEGQNAVKTGRVMLGATNPADSAPGTIRGDMCINVGRNILHGSDAVEAAQKEIALWFSNDELNSYESAAASWVYEGVAPKADAKKQDKKDKKAAKKADAAPVKAKLSPEEEAIKLRLKKEAAATKEGGKKGVEIEGAADMGGLDFFCTTIDSADGQADLLQLAMEGMNHQADPNNPEERKGCSGHIGKMIFSAGVEKLQINAYVPADKVKMIDCSKWLADVCQKIGATVISSTSENGTAELCLDKEKGVFPIKKKDDALAASFSYLKENNAFPDKESDDSDELCFGDDAFDEINGE